MDKNVHTASNGLTYSKLWTENIIWKHEFKKNLTSSRKPGTHALSIKIICSPWKSWETIPLIPLINIYTCSSRSTWRISPGSIVQPSASLPSLCTATYLLPASVPSPSPEVTMRPVGSNHTACEAGTGRGTRRKLISWSVQSQHSWYCFVYMQYLPHAH